jgi:prophage regulatory protein
MSLERLKPIALGRPPQSQEKGARRIIRLPEVIAVTGLSRSAIYDGVQKNTFPRPVPLSARAVGWLEDEIAAWQAGRIAARDRALRQERG